MVYTRKPLKKYKTKKYKTLKKYKTKKYKTKKYKHKKYIKIGGVTPPLPRTRLAASRMAASKALPEVVPEAGPAEAPKAAAAPHKSSQPLHTSGQSKKKSSGPSIKVKVSLRPPSLWKRLSPNKQSLCKKVPPKNNIVDKCELYNSTSWFHHNYDITKVKQNDSPIITFKEGDDETETKDYAELQDGIYNFILYWDESTDKYMLVTSFFNAIEYGSKHNMIVLRETKTPDTFIISGEFKKFRKNITFHDVSSQYFLDNPCNIKKQMLITAVYDIIKQKGWSQPDAIKNLKYLKDTIIEMNNFSEKNQTAIKNAKSYDEFIDLLSRNSPSGIVGDNYKQLITNLMTDAFERIFGFNSGEINMLYVTKFKETKTMNEYGDQKDIKKFMATMCKPEHNIKFDLYNNNECSGEKIGTTCNEVTTPTTAHQP